MAKEQQKEEVAEEQDEIMNEQANQEGEGQRTRLPHQPQPKRNPSASPSSAFVFWAYFTISVSLVTFSLTYLPFLRKEDPQSWFVSLPGDLRSHYNRGRLIKAQLGSGHHEIQVFAVEHGPRNAQAEVVLLVHGLGCNSYSFRDILRLVGSRGIRAVAVDLPGSGFSEGFTERGGGGVLGGVWGVYKDIREKGLFWGFEQLVERGYVEYEEEKPTSYTRSENIPLYGSEQLSRVLEQVIDSLRLAPVHLVLHDSALHSGTSWTSMNPGSVRSITFIDSTPKSAAFPAWFMGVPLLRELALKSRGVFAGLLRLCCDRSIDASSAEAHRLILNGKGKRPAVVASGMALNFSFDLGEWAASDEVKDLPLQVLWSHAWSDLWIDEGKRIAQAIPRARFIPHFGGRWPQEGRAEEIAEQISEFILSLPKSDRHSDEQELLQKNIKSMFEEDATDQIHHHNQHESHHGHGHNHDHAAGDMSAYGLNHGWGS